MGKREPNFCDEAQEEWELAILTVGSENVKITSKAHHPQSMIPVAQDRRDRDQLCLMRASPDVLLITIALNLGHCKVI